MRALQKRINYCTIIKKKKKHFDPKVTQFQRHKENYESISTDNYYRKSPFIPFIDYFVSQFELGLTIHKTTLSIVQNFISNKLIKLSENEIMASADIMSKQWALMINLCDNIFN